MIRGMAWLDALRPELARVAGACHDDPHTLLGAHMRGGRLAVLTFLPAVTQAWLPGGRGRAYRGAIFSAGRGRLATCPCTIRSTGSIATALSRPGSTPTVLRRRY